MDHAPDTRARRSRGPLLAGAAAAALAGAVWLALGGFRSVPPMTQEAALERAAELGERLRAGVQNQRDVSDLRPAIEELLAAKPGLAAGWTLLGQVLLLEDDPAAASDALGRALEIRAAEGAAAADAAADAQLHLLAGGAAEAVGGLAEAEAHFAAAARLAPDDAQAALRLAHTAHGLGRSELAAELARDATELDASLAAAWALRGQLAAEAGEPDAALAAAERAAALTAEAGGRDARAYALALARMLRERGRPLVAARVLRLPKPEDFFTPNVMAAHAEALAAGGLPEGAANYYERWLALDPANALAAAEATRWYLEAGNPEKAGATLVLLERIDPRDGRLAGLRAELERGEG